MEDSPKSGWVLLFFFSLPGNDKQLFLPTYNYTINQQQFRSVGNLFLLFSFSRRCKYKPTTVVEATAIWTKREYRAISIHPTHWQKTTSSLYMPSPFVCLSVVCSQHATNFALLFPTPETLVCFHLDGVRDRPNSFETKRNCVFFFPLARCVLLHRFIFWNIFNDVCVCVSSSYRIFIFVGVESVGVVIKNKTRSATVMQ